MDSRTKEVLKRINPLQIFLDSRINYQFSLPDNEIELYRERLIVRKIRRMRRVTAYKKLSFPQANEFIKRLNTLPLTTKTDLRGNESRYTASKFFEPDFLVSKAVSSGTTGLSISLKRSLWDVAFEQAILNWWRKSIGWQPKDTVAFLRIDFPKEFERGELFVRLRGTTRWLMNSYQLNRNTIESYADFFNTVRPKIIYALPTSLTILLQLFEELEIRCQPPKMVVTSSEVVTANLRALVKRVWDVPLFEWYGNAERTVAAGQCKKGRFHFFWNYSIVETSENEEIIGTPLQFHKTQFLRYESGDFVSDFSNLNCECGLAGPHGASIAGRLNDYVVAGDGSKYSQLSIIFHDELAVLAGQIIQRSSGHIDIKLVMSQDDRATLKSVENKMRRRIPGRTITATRVETLEKTAAGKVPMVIREFAD